jgi:hypothetical protein
LFGLIKQFSVACEFLGEWGWVVQGISVSKKAEEG